MLRVEATPVERERLSIAQAGKLLDELDAVNDRLVEMDDRRASDDWEVGLLRALSPAPAGPGGQARGTQEPGGRPRARGGRRSTSSATRQAAAGGRLLELETSGAPCSRNGIGCSPTSRR